MSLDIFKLADLKIGNTQYNNIITIIELNIWKGISTSFDKEDVFSKILGLLPAPWLWAGSIAVGHSSALTLHQLWSSLPWLHYFKNAKYNTIFFFEKVSIMFNPWAKGQTQGRRGHCGPLVDDYLHLWTGPCLTPPARWHSSRQPLTAERAGPGSSPHFGTAAPWWDPQRNSIRNKFSTYDKD